MWNAAQRQLVRDGWMHNYLRMLWGKKILEWTASPRAALDTMTRLMNRYALDGRDPNWYSGYAWTLGRYDRPWGPERAIFGTVRYMSSTNAAKKLRMKNYLHTYGDGALPSVGADHLFSARPPRAPVNSSSRRAIWPLTMTQLMPSAIWCGSW